MDKFSGKKIKKGNFWGFLKNHPFYFTLKSKIAGIFNRKGDFAKKLGHHFYFNLASFVLMGFLFFASGSFAEQNYLNSGNITNSLVTNNAESGTDSPFFSQNNSLALETPDLKIEDNFIYGISTPRVLTTQTLGDIFGSASPQSSKDVINYTVQPGDTISSVAQNFNISSDTLLWSNNLASGASLKEGQNLVILPVSGILYIVKSGDTVGQIAKIYKSKSEDIISFNNLANEGDLFIGDILVIPGGVMPKRPVPSIVQNPVPDSFFIYPAEGLITQGLHYYNAIDLANQCGTPVYAAASGTVQRTRYGWNYGGGNQVTILHSGGIVSYYGHLQTIFVKSGDSVTVGDRIGLMGQTGLATGCHVHFEVIGAKNPLARYSVGTTLKYK